MWMMSEATSLLLLSSRRSQTRLPSRLLHLRWSLELMKNLLTQCGSKHLFGQYWPLFLYCIIVTLPLDRANDYLWGLLHSFGHRLKLHDFTQWGKTIVSLLNATDKLETLQDQISWRSMIRFNHMVIMIAFWTTLDTVMVANRSGRQTHLMRTVLQDIRPSIASVKHSQIHRQIHSTQLPLELFRLSYQFSSRHKVRRRQFGNSNRRHSMELFPPSKLQQNAIGSIRWGDFHGFYHERGDVQNVDAIDSAS